MQRTDRAGPLPMGPTYEELNLLLDDADDLLGGQRHQVRGDHRIGQIGDDDPAA